MDCLAQWEPMMSLGNSQIWGNMSLLGLGIYTGRKQCREPVHHNPYEVNTNIFTSQMKNLKIRGFESLILSPAVLHGRLQTLSTSSWKGWCKGFGITGLEPGCWENTLCNLPDHMWESTTKVTFSTRQTQLQLHPLCVETPPLRQNADACGSWGKAVPWD